MGCKTAGAEAGLAEGLAGEVLVVPDEEVFELLAESAKTSEQKKMKLKAKK
jgi:hypothetical protein